MQFNFQGQPLFFSKFSPADTIPYPIFHCCLRKLMFWA